MPLRDPTCKLRLASILAGLKFPIISSMSKTTISTSAPPPQLMLPHMITSWAELGLTEVETVSLELKLDVTLFKLGY